MKERDVILALGNAAKPLGGIEICDQMAADKGYGRIRKFFFSNYGSLYPELARLEKRGEIKHEVVPGLNSRPRYFYRLTENGRRRFEVLKEARRMDEKEK